MPAKPTGKTSPKAPAKGGTGRIPRLPVNPVKEGVKPKSAGKPAPKSKKAAPKTNRAGTAAQPQTGREARQGARSSARRAGRGKGVRPVIPGQDGAPPVVPAP